MDHVIKVNGVVWNIIDSTNYIIERLGIRARLLWEGPKHGKMLTRDVQNGRMRSQKFIAD